MFNKLLELYNTLSSNTIAVSIILTPLITGLSYLLLRRIPFTFWNCFKSLFSINVTIYQAIDHDAFNTGEYILGKYKLNSVFKSFILRTVSFINKPIFTTSQNTIFFMFIENMLVLVNRFSDNQDKMNHYFILSFTFFTRNKNKVINFFNRMHKEKDLGILSDELKIFTPDKYADSWTEILKRKKYHTPKTQSQKYILDRVIKYVNKKDFDKLGIMLYGKPGCGKSDIIEQLVSELGYRLYYFNSGNLKEHGFMDLISCVKMPSVIVFEDIDCCTVTHNREKTKDDKADGYNSISLSTLLNVFDGLMSLDKQIIIATTNHIDKLDEALKRKGRFDISIELLPMNEEEIIDYIADYFDVSRSDVILEIVINIGGTRTYSLSFPIATISAACKEADDYKEAIKIILST